MHRRRITFITIHVLVAIPEVRVLTLNMPLYQGSRGGVRRVRAVNQSLLMNTMPSSERIPAYVLLV